MNQGLCTTVCDVLSDSFKCNAGDDMLHYMFWLCRCPVLSVHQANLQDSLQYLLGQP